MNTTKYECKQHELDYRLLCPMCQEPAKLFLKKMDELIKDSLDAEWRKKVIEEANLIF